jgi:hypothetical protein
MWSHSSQACPERGRSRIELGKLSAEVGTASWLECQAQPKSPPTFTVSQWLFERLNRKKGTDDQGGGNARGLAEGVFGPSDVAVVEGFQDQGFLGRRIRLCNDEGV